MRRSLGNPAGVTVGASFMREPIVYFGIGFLLAALLIFGAKLLARSRFGRLARTRLQSVAPNLMADIEADMGELHAQIAAATRRLETSVEQMRSKTTSQLSEIGRSSEAITRLKAELGERSVTLGALAAREKALHEQLRVTETEFGMKSAALTEVEKKLAQEKSELTELMEFVDARDNLAEIGRRHAAAMESVRAQNRSLEEELGASYDERIKLEHELASLKRQVEATWATERMANAVLRERINDVAGEVVRVAHALEGLGSPIETMLAGKASELAASLEAGGAGSTGNGAAAGAGGDDSKGSLAWRIRSLQKRAARVASDGGA
jgi:chromosome segregation ATPase